MFNGPSLRFVAHSIQTGFKNDWKGYDYMQKPQTNQFQDYIQGQQQTAHDTTNDGIVCDLLNMKPKRNPPAREPVIKIEEH